MDGYLLDHAVVARHEESYKTTNHLYPNENIVRLVKWFFPTQEGMVLDYGFGPGENLIHLLRVGYDVAGVEVSQRALDLTAGKLKALPQYDGRHELYLLRPEDDRLPYGDGTFDYIVSNQTVYFLVTREKIDALLREFHRVLRPGGRMIVTMASRLNSMCTDGTPIGEDMYASHHKGHPDAPEDMPNRIYVTRDEGHVRELFRMFSIHEVGHFDNYYCGMAGHHYVVLASKGVS